MKKFIRSITICIAAFLGMTVLLSMDKVCQRCEGTGTLRNECHSCHGLGYRECMTCNGTKSLRCT